MLEPGQGILQDPASDHASGCHGKHLLLMRAAGEESVRPVLPPSLSGPTFQCCAVPVCMPTHWYVHACSYCHACKRLQRTRSSRRCPINGTDHEPGAPKFCKVGSHLFYAIGCHPHELQLGELAEGGWQGLQLVEGGLQLDQGGCSPDTVWELFEPARIFCVTADCMLESLQRHCSALWQPTCLALLPVQLLARSNLCKDAGC